MQTDSLPTMRYLFEALGAGMMAIAFNYPTINSPQESLVLCWVLECGNQAADNEALIGG